MSAIGFAPSGQTLHFSILSHVAPDLTQRKHWLKAEHEQGFTETFFVQSQPVRIYADASGGYVRIDRIGGSGGEATATFVVTGEQWIRRHVYLDDRRTIVRRDHFTFGCMKSVPPRGRDCVKTQRATNDAESVG